MALKKASKLKKVSKSVVKKKSSKKVSKPVVKQKLSTKKALKPTSKPFTKTELINFITERSDQARKVVSSVLDGLFDAVESQMTQRGSGEFTLPGLIKLKRIKKPATKARKGINPFTGEETIFKAKPAKNVVKARALKKLKNLIN